MRDIDIKQLLQKSQELKALFVLGQRVIPFLEEMFRFIEEISPILDVINTSIEDNLQKMPKASMQLSKVSEATELATTEIMDTLDGLVLKSYTISTNLKNISSHVGTQASPDSESTESSIAQSEELLNSIREDANTIIMALQIQDITSQQLAAVNHLLETVQKRLSEIMKEFREPETNPLPEVSSSKSPTNVSQLHRNIAFDTNAIDSLNKSHGTTRQDNVDSIFNVPDAARKSNVVSSQDDIDALFGAPTKKAESTGPSSQDDIDALFGAPAKKAESTDPSSQDDIDALFGASTKKAESTGPSSQDDIDALFGASTKKAESTEPSSQDDIDALFGASTKKAESTEPSSQDDIDALFGASSKTVPPAPATSSSPKKDTPHPDSGDVSQNDINALFNNPT